MRDPLRWLLALVLLLLGAGAVPWVANEWSAFDARREQSALAAGHAAVGRAALEAGDPELAARAFGEALDGDPRRAEWREALVDARVQQVLKFSGTLDVAEGVRLQETLGAALAARPQPTAPLLVAYGKLLLARGDDQGARRQFQRAIEVDNKFAPAHHNLGVACLRAEELTAAVESLEKALALDVENATIELALGQARFQQKNWEEATKHLERAGKKLEEPGLFVTLGKSLAEQGKQQEAVKAFEKALALRPDLPSVHGPLGAAYASLGRDLLAERHLKRAWELSGDRDAYARLGRLYERRDQTEAALQVFGELAQIDDEMAEPHLRIGLMAEKHGDLKLAAQALQVAMERAARALEKDPDQEQTLLTAKGKLDEVRKRLEGAQAAATPHKK
jgi:tetratricopeptide (TPR) repeat protein